jgi:hypothetical protein
MILIPLIPIRYLKVYIVWSLLLLLGITGIISIIFLTYFELGYNNLVDNITSILINGISFLIIIFLIKELFRIQRSM